MITHRYIFEAVLNNSGPLGISYATGSRSWTQRWLRHYEWTLVGAWALSLRVSVLYRPLSLRHRIYAGQAVRAEPGPATRRMQTKLETPQGHDTYSQRKWLVEVPIGWIKRILGFRQFGLRGLHPVQSGWDRGSLAMNVKRLHRLLRP